MKQKIKRTVSKDISNNIPKELKNCNQWIIWRYVHNQGDAKPAKEPIKKYNGRNFGRCSATDKNNFLSFDQAYDLYKSHPNQVSGIGFVFTENDNFIGVDYDGCLDENNEATWGESIVKDLNTYTEISPSGNGLHSIGLGKLDPKWSKKSKHFHNSKLEIYDQGRFFTFTGNVYKNLSQINEILPQCEAICQKMRKPSNEKNHIKQNIENSDVHLRSIDEVISIIEKIADKGNQAEKNFLYLHNEGFINEDKSADDYFYFCKLAFYTAKNADLMKQIYFQSALVRDKSERDDYIQRTINSAIESCESIYTKSYKGKLPLIDEVLDYILRLSNKKIAINEGIIIDMVKNCFWHNNNLYLLSQANTLIYCKEKDAPKFLLKRHGQFITNEQLHEIVNCLNNDLTPAATKKEAQNIYKSLMQIIIDYIKYYCQCSKLSMRVDMYCKQGFIEFNQEEVCIVFPHTPYEDNLNNYSEEIVNDYKLHFPKLDEFLKFIVAARFASDRKKAYLWIYADSDWGKGFLMSILDSLNVIIELSVREIEKILEGQPANKDMMSFKGRLILCIDEFKHVKSEVKQLQSHIWVSPKFQLATKVEIYAKLFFSAENVESLIGEHGSEDQFSNRFSVFREEGTLNTRPLFKKVGQAEYFKHICSYVAKKLNSLIKEFIDKDKNQAQHDADSYISEFHSKYGLDNYCKRFSESIPKLADELHQDIIETYLSSNEELYNSSLSKALAGKIKNYNGNLYLTSPAKVFLCWLEDKVDPVSLRSIKRKKELIYSHISDDGSGYKNYNIGGRSIKAIKLKPSDLSLPECPF